MILWGICAVMPALTGCSATRVVDSWRDDAYTGRPASMLIMGVAEERGERTLLEEEFMRQLQARGVTVFGGTALFPGDALPAKEDVVAKAEALRVDAVLVVRYLREFAGETHTPVRHYNAPVGFATSWDDYRDHPSITETGIRDVAYDFTYAVLETKLFDRVTQQPVWSALTETKYQEHPLKQIGPFVSTILRDLDSAGLLPKP